MSEEPENGGGKGREKKKKRPTPGGPPKGKQDQGPSRGKHGPSQGPTRPAAPQGSNQGHPRGPGGHQYARGSPQGGYQGPPQRGYQGPPRGPPQGGYQGPPRGPPPGGHQYPPQGPPQRGYQGPPQGPPQGGYQGPPQGPPQGGYQGPPQGPPQRGYQGPPQGPPQGGYQGPPQGHTQGGYQGPPQGHPQGGHQGPGSGMAYNNPYQSGTSLLGQVPGPGPHGNMQGQGYPPPGSRNLFDHGERGREGERGSRRGQRGGRGGGKGKYDDSGRREFGSQSSLNSDNRGRGQPFRGNRGGRGREYASRENLSSSTASIPSILDLDLQTRETSQTHGDDRGRGRARGRGRGWGRGRGEGRGRGNRGNSNRGKYSRNANLNREVSSSTLSVASSVDAWEDEEEDEQDELLQIVESYIKKKRNRRRRTRDNSRDATPSKSIFEIDDEGNAVASGSSESAFRGSSRSRGSVRGRGVNVHMRGRGRGGYVRGRGGVRGRGETTHPEKSEKSISRSRLSMQQEEAAGQTLEEDEAYSTTDEDAKPEVHYKPISAKKKGHVPAKFVTTGKFNKAGRGKVSVRKSKVASSEIFGNLLKDMPTDPGEELPGGSEVNNILMGLLKKYDSGSEKCVLDLEKTSELVGREGAVGRDDGSGEATEGLLKKKKRIRKKKTPDRIRTSSERSSASDGGCQTREMTTGSRAVEDEDEEVSDVQKAFTNLLTQFGGRAKMTELLKQEEKFPKSFFDPDWLQKHGKKFLIFKKKGLIEYVSAYFREAKLCVYYNSPKGCTNQECEYFHVCSGFVTESCKPHLQKCPRTHNFFEKENGVLVAKLGLKDFKNKEIAKIVRCTVPETCKEYNHGTCRDDYCPFLHVCDQFPCKCKSCQLEHKCLSSDHNKWVLSCFRIVHFKEYNLMRMVLGKNKPVELASTHVSCGQKEPSLTTPIEPTTRAQYEPESRVHNEPTPRSQYEPAINLEPLSRASPEPAPRAPPEPAPRTYPEPAPRTYPEPAPRTHTEPLSRAPPEPAPRTYPEPAPRTYPEQAPQDRYELDPRTHTEQAPQVRYEPDPRANPEQSPRVYPEPAQRARYEPTQGARYEPAPRAYPEPAPQAQYEPDPRTYPEPAPRTYPEQAPQDRYELDPRAHTEQAPQVRYEPNPRANPEQSLRVYPEPAQGARYEPTQGARYEPTQGARYEPTQAARYEPTQGARYEPTPRAYPEPAPQAQYEPDPRAYPEPTPRTYPEPAPRARYEQDPRSQTEPVPRAQYEPTQGARYELDPRAYTEPGPRAEPGPRTYPEPAPRAEPVHVTHHEPTPRVYEAVPKAQHQASPRVEAAPSGSVVEIGEGQYLCEQHTWETCKKGHACPYYHASRRMPYQWQVELKKDSWTNFPDMANERCEKAFCSLESSVNRMFMSSVILDINLDKMTARLTLSDPTSTVVTDDVKVRRLSTRSYCEGEGVLSYFTFWCWYWLDNGHRWNLYEPDKRQYTLEKKLLYGQSEYYFENVLENSTFHYQLTFAMNGMVQKNLETGNVRQVIRRPLFVSPRDVEDKIVLSHPDLLQQAPKLPHDMPTHWTPLDLVQSFELVSLDVEANMYLQVKRRLYATMPQNQYRITAIYQVQNPTMWDKHLSHKRSMEHTAQREGLIEPINEQQLFHGTDSEEVVRGICVNGFDFRVSGKNGTVYGKGAYFARDASYSNNYTNIRGKKYMFQAKVLVGRFTKGTADMTRPPPRAGHVLYDSCVNDINQPTIFVTFDQNQSYPEFLIEYEDLSPGARVPAPQPTRPSPSAQVPLSPSAQVPLSPTAQKPLAYPASYSMPAYPHHTYNPPPPTSPGSRTPRLMSQPKKSTDSCAVM